MQVPVSNTINAKSTYLNFHLRGVEEWHHVRHNTGVNNHLYLLISSVCEVR